MLKHMPPMLPGQARPPRTLNRSQPPLVLTPSALSVSQLPNNPPKLANGGLSSMLNTPSVSSSTNLLQKKEVHQTGAREALTSLGLLCLVSLLLALLSLIFLLKISPGREPPPGPTPPEDYTIVYDVTLALCALSLSLNLCCLLVCAIQFLFAVKLVRAPATSGRGNKYLQKSSVSRVCAVGGFFISIPIFLTGIILYTFTQFQSTPAIVTSVLIGIGILFCGGAMAHNVFVWQKEKTISVRQSSLNMTLQQQSPISAITPPAQFLSHNNSLANHLVNPSLGLASNNVNNISSSTNLLNNTNNLLHMNHSHTNGPNLTPMTHTSQMSHTTPVTPLSPNHSHVSFNNHSHYLPGYGMRTQTPPTPKVSQTLNGRDLTGSVSPGMQNNSITGALDISNVTTTNSPHELSTLV